MLVNLMIEGQEDVKWEEWVSLAKTVEAHAAFEGLFRSDHYLSVTGHHRRGSLDAWTTIAALAGITQRIRLGTLVSPATFRHPSVLAKAAVTCDHISGGRIDVGLGTGWHHAEHVAYGFDFPGVRTRLEIFEEQLEIVHRSWTEEGFSFRGKHYELRRLDARFKPVQSPHPILIAGGNGRPRVMRGAALWVDEYNTYFVPPEEMSRRRQMWERAWEAAGRSEDVRFSAMLGVVPGETRRDLAARARRLMTGDGDPMAFLQAQRARWVSGTPQQIIEQLQAYERAGVQRVMLQLLLHDDLEAVELIGRHIAPALG
jgi:alkanesulfonate monooxygenase SsuD/methylene tetrahydromethanopterin reductase-like flavin-dependent oxidoreductase (luciferase family)